MKQWRKENPKEKKPQIVRRGKKNREEEEEESKGEINEEIKEGEVAEKEEK